MKPFMDKDFLLSTPTAQELYHEYAADMPIIDYHCHVSPREIFEDRRFENITQVWLGGDHYKWRVMRSNGVEKSTLRATRRTGEIPEICRGSASCHRKPHVPLVSFGAEKVLRL